MESRVTKSSPASSWVSCCLAALRITVVWTLLFIIPGVGVHEADGFRCVAGVAGFLAQFARCRFQWAFAWIDHAAGQFQFDQVGALPVLLDHHQLIVRCKGDDVAPIDRLDTKNSCSSPVRGEARRSARTLKIW
ncbi:MAG: hypothetical protein CM1200mP34_2950 [Verrucomicrobiales bacterium]|nr:MAG: hypothetical protein CM1200mP34_2950 [Verrucomicrobiales bacterium]